MPVLREGPMKRLDDLTALVGRSLYKSARWRDRLEAAAKERELDHDRIVHETDPSDDMEGLYIKVEAAGVVADRAKWVRPGFLQVVVDSDSHWQSRPS